MTIEIEKRALQGIVLVLAAVPVSAGAAGAALGPGFLGLAQPWPADLDSHLRYLSGILLALGLAWWSCVPQIEAKGSRFRLLAVLTATGGLGRLLSLAQLGAPSAGHMIGLFLELVAVPALVLWQARIEHAMRRYLG